MPGIHIHRRQDFLWLIFDQSGVSVEMLERIAASLQEALKQPPRLLVVTSTGEHTFCSDADLQQDSPEQRERLSKAAARVSAIFTDLHTRGIVTVALVKSLACGAGCELALLCDTVIARADAEFRFPTAGTELFPLVISACLPKVVGQEMATRLVQGGEKLTAQQAMRLGLVHQVLPVRHYLEDVEELLVLLSTVK